MCGVCAIVFFINEINFNKYDFFYSTLQALKAYMTPDECLDYLNTYFRVVDPSKYNHALFFLVRSLSKKICELGPLPSSPPKTAGVLAALDAVKVEANDRPGGQQPPRSA